jgi:AraC family transcriptional regulator, regulatory protein of adaptative response / DNA-3-methyladenine glycosylase II
MRVDASTISHFDLGPKPHGETQPPSVQALVDLQFEPTGVTLKVRLAQETDQSAQHVKSVVHRVRAWLDLDAEIVTIDAHLRCDPALAPLVNSRPGLRVPGTVDPFETAVRAIIGQQVSVAGARTVAGRLALAVGPQLQIPDPEITCLFPGPTEILAAPDALFAMPEARRLTIRRLAEAVTQGVVDLEVRADNTVNDICSALLAIKGIGPWTASYIAMRALGDRDVFLPTDLGVIRSLQRHTSDHSGPIDSERWRPFRSYALHHLWLD